MGVFYQRASELYDQQRYDLAQRDLLRELEQSPDNADAHALLGMCQNCTGQREQALAHCKEAIRLAPGSAYAHYALGYVLLDSDRLAEAAVSMLEAIRLHPSSSSYTGQLSFIRWRQGHYKEALALADAALALEARSPFCLNRRAMALASLGRLAEAEQVVRTALAINPENPYTLANWGWILLRSGRGDEAAQALREALRRQPTMVWARDHLIDALILLVNQKKSALALKHFDVSLERDPGLEEGRQRLVRALVDMEEGLLPTLLMVGWLAACLNGPSPGFRHGNDFVPLLLVLMIADLAFPPGWGMKWAAQAMCLAFRRLGRRLVSGPHRRGLVPLLVAASGAAVTAPLAMLTGSDLAATLYALFLALLTPLAYLPQCQLSWQRTTLNLYLGMLTSWGLGLTVLTALGSLTAEQAYFSRGVLLVVGVAGSAVLGRVLVSLGKRSAPQLS